LTKVAVEQRRYLLLGRFRLAGVVEDHVPAGQVLRIERADVVGHLPRAQLGGAQVPGQQRPVLRLVMKLALDARRLADEE
jgi:hypothetical protein